MTAIGDSNKATMILDMVKFGSKSNAGKGEVKFTFSSHDNPHLNQFLIENAGNPVDLFLQSVQGSLELVTRAASRAPAASSNGAHADEPDAEITTMIVNGEPASVKRPRKTKGSEPEDLVLPEQYNGMDRDAAGNAFRLAPETHEFIQHRADNRCWLCGLWDTHEYHTGVEEDRPWSDEDKPMRHAFRPSSDGRCRWCYLDPTNELHFGSLAEDETEGEMSAIDEMAQSLIDSIEQPAAEAVGAAEGA